MRLNWPSDGLSGPTASENPGGASQRSWWRWSRKSVDEAHDLLAGPLSDDDLVEEDLVDGVVDRSEGALVNVRDGDETVELGVVHQGASDGGSGASKLLGQLDLVGEEQLNVLGHARAVPRRLLMQLDERVLVARDDLAGEGFDVGGAP